MVFSFCLFLDNCLIFFAPLLLIAFVVDFAIAGHGLWNSIRALDFQLTFSVFESRVIVSYFQITS